MISFNHIGNLGRIANQMFQYASLKGIAKNRGYEFCIPTEQVFGQKDPLVKEDVFNIYRIFNLDKKNTVQVCENPVLMETTHEFDENLFNNCPDNIDLFGYYQSPKYFQHIQNEIRDDFTFSKEVQNSCKEVFDEVVDCEDPISLHIRRTDYLVNPNHPVQPLEYYKEALSLLDQNKTVIIFSDDAEWCQQQEMFSDDRFVISQDSDADFDMCLMSMCTNHIIANSSFSWWGAWLGRSEKIIAPKNWFSDSCADKSVKDMVFSNWTWL